MQNWTREQLKNNAKMNFYKNYWMCVAMALVLTIVLMMEPDGVKEEIVVKVREYTNVFPAYGHHGWFAGLFDGVGYWLGMLWSVFTIFLAWGLLLLKVFAGNVIYVGGIRFFIQNRRENPPAERSSLDFRMAAMETLCLPFF